MGFEEMFWITWLIAFVVGAGIGFCIGRYWDKKEDV